MRKKIKSKFPILIFENVIELGFRLDLIYKNCRNFIFILIFMCVKSHINLCSLKKKITRRTTGARGCKFLTILFTFFLMILKYFEPFWVIFNLFEPIWNLLIYFEDKYRVWNLHFQLITFLVQKQLWHTFNNFKPLWTIFNRSNFWKKVNDI